VYVEYYERTGINLGIQGDAVPVNPVKKSAEYNRFNEIEIVTEGEDMKYFVSLSHKIENSQEQVTDKYEVPPQVYIRIESILTKPPMNKRGSTYIGLGVMCAVFAAISFTAAVTFKDIYIQNNSQITLILGLALGALAVVMTAMIFVMANRASNCIKNDAYAAENKKVV
jgi:hypothetical protein